MEKAEREHCWLDSLVSQVSAKHANSKSSKQGVIFASSYVSWIINYYNNSIISIKQIGLLHKCSS